MTGVPYTFSAATAPIPLSQLDANFNTTLTIGTTSVGLGNTTSTIAGLTSLGIGMTPSNILDITQSQNARSRISLLNNNASSGAFCDLLLSNGTNGLDLVSWGTGFTTSGMNRQDGGFIGHGGAGGLTITTQAAQPIYFGINSVEAARFDTNKCLLIGETSTWFGSGGRVSARGGTSTYPGSFYNSGSSGAACLLRVDSTTPYLLDMYYASTEIGYINTNGANVYYTTVSDETLKNFDVKQRDFRTIIKTMMVQDAEYIAFPGDNALSISAQQCAMTGFMDPITCPDYDNPEKKWAADYGRLGILALWGVKDLYAETEALKARVATLEARLTALENK